MMYYCHAKLTKEVLKLLGIRSSIISKHQLMKVSLNVHERILCKNIRTGESPGTFFKVSGTARGDPAECPSMFIGNQVKNEEA